jgi:uncharacterized membrane protein YdbT with pleckstrin-like domain
MCIFFQLLPHISISMSLKSFSIYIVKFFELYISAVLLPIEFSSASSKYGSTFICWRHKWRDLVYEYAWAKSPMISGYASGGETDYHCRVPELTHTSSCNIINAVDFSSLSLKSFNIYIVKFFELYISAVLLPIVL